METTDTAAVEETEAVPETTEAETEAVETTEETETVEEVLFAGKYKSPEDLEKGYTEMQSLYNSRYKGFTGAPESGEYEAVPVEGVEQAEVDALSDSPVFQKFKERGLERGMSNEMFNDVINDYITTQREETQATVSAEMQKLGDNAKVRIENVVSKLGTILEGDQLEGLKLTLSTASSIEALETLLDRDVNTVAPAETAVDTTDKESELQELWTAVDDKGRRKMEYDGDYRKMVNKKWNEFYNE